jgi:hypothetical protein
MCKLIKDEEPQIKFFFDDFICLEDALKIEINDIETKLAEHEKGINRTLDECKLLNEKLQSNTLNEDEQIVCKKFI